MAKTQPTVVLVADRTLSADYRILLEGMMGTMQTTRTPGWLMRRVLARPLATDPDGRAVRAPLGIRRLEAALVHAGVAGREEVVCTTPEALGRVLGPSVKVVAVSSGDPAGRGMSNSTTEPLFGGELYSRRWMDRLLTDLRAAKERYGFRLLAGGPGTWQWTQEPALARQRGIDGLFEGYFEARGPRLFADLLAGGECPWHTRETGTAVEAVRPILAPSALGAVEITRGCGRGCRFCLSAEAGMADLPLETILADVETNVRGGVRTLVLGSEDCFRFGSAGLTVRFDALRGLLEAVGRIEGISLLQVDHANVTSIVQLSVEELREIRRLLVGGRKLKWPWLNIGVESASGSLVRASAPGKIAPFREEDWPEMVRQAAERLTEAGFFPLFSFVLGLPGETPADLDRSIALVRELTGRPAAVFPIFLEPLPERGGDRRFLVGELTPRHLELLSAGYEANFRWVPEVFADNQRAAGVSWARRALFQCLGKAQVPLWRRRFREMGRRVNGAPQAARASSAGAEGRSGIAAPAVMKEAK